MDVSEGEQDAQEGVKGQNGMVKDSEFHFSSRKKTLSCSNAGGKFGFDESGKMGSRAGKRSLFLSHCLEMALVAHIVAIPWL